MEDDIDIYADLTSFVVKPAETASNGIEEENLELKKRIAELSEQLEQFRKQNETLEVNLCSLLKTAKAEIARKDRTIGELRKELDDTLFKRGKHTTQGQGPYARQNGATFKQEEQICASFYSTAHSADNFLGQPLNNNVKKTREAKTKPVDAALSAEEDNSEEWRKNIDRATSTIFGKRLCKRLAEAEAAEKADHARCNYKNSNVATSAPGYETGYVVESDKENGQRKSQTEKRPCTRKNSTAEHSNASSKRTDSKRSQDELDGAESAKRIKLDAVEKEVRESREEVSTRVQPRYHSHHSSFREAQGQKRLNGDRDKYFSTHQFSDGRDQGERSYYERRTYSRRDKSTEKSRSSHDEAESDRLHSDKTRDGYWHDHDYIDHHRYRLHKDRDHSRDQSSSERSTRRSRNSSFSNDNRYRKERRDRSSSNYSNSSSHSKYEQESKSKSSGRTSHKSKLSMHKHDSHEQSLNKDNSSSKDEKKQSNGEGSFDQTKVQKPSEVEHSKPLGVPSKNSTKEILPLELKKSEQDIQLSDASAVKAEVKAVIHLNLSFEDGEIPDTPHFSPINANHNIKNSATDSAILETDTRNSGNITERTSHLGPDNEETIKCGKSQTDAKMDVLLEQTETVECGPECSKTVDKQNVIYSIPETKLTSTDSNDGCVSSGDPCEVTTQKVSTNETLKEIISEKKDVEQRMESDTVIPFDKVPNLEQITETEQSAENATSTSAQEEDNRKTKEGNEKIGKQRSGTKHSSKTIEKTSRNQKPSQSRAAPVNIKSKMIVVVRRKNPVRLADNNASMTVFMNSKSANVESTTKSVRTDSKSRACRHADEKSVSRTVLPDS